jgi:hypothetical protein
MQSLRYSINVTLEGCCDHRAIVADEELHRHAAGHREAHELLEALGLLSSNLVGKAYIDLLETAAV